MEFVALLSKNDETWAQVAGLIKHGDWEKVILVGEGDSLSRFSINEKSEIIETVKVDLSQKIKDLRNDLMQKLKGRIDGTEVALSIASGDGKEHMALISALINSPVGIRFAALTKEGIIDL